MKIEFVAASAQAPSGGAAAVLVFEGAALSAFAARLDQEAGGALARAIAATGFTGAKGRSLDVVAPAGLDVARVLLIGAGTKESFDAAAAETARRGSLPGAEDLGRKGDDRRAGRFRR